MKVCRVCKSEQVQVLKLCWADPNSDGPGEVDWDSEPGVMGYSATTWCKRCLEHTDQVDSDDMPPSGGPTTRKRLVEAVRELIELCDPEGEVTREDREAMHDKLDTYGALLKELGE